MVAVNGKPRNEIVQASPKSTNKVFLSPAMGYFTLLNILGYDEKIGWRRTKDGSIFSTVMIERWMGVKGGKLINGSEFNTSG